MDTSRPLSEVEVERVSLLRYQLLSVGEMMKQPSPLNVLAINPMQDVVEATLGQVGERVRADVKARTDFDKLFDAVIAALGAPIELVGLRASAIAMNNARVAFKHHGNQVRDQTLRRHHDVALTLVHELIEHGLGVKLDDVSLLAFISDAEARRLIETAEAHHARNDIVSALTYLRAAFDRVVDEYEARKSVNGAYPIFQIAPTGAGLHLGATHGFGKPLEVLRAWVEALDSRVRMASVGVDLSRFAFFDAVAPQLMYAPGGARGPWTHVRYGEPTDADYEASYVFVVDTAVRLASRDFNLKPAAWTSTESRSYDPEFRSEAYLAQEEENRKRIEAREASSAQTE